MNILITGGTGFIGRALILRLRQDGHAVSAYVRNTNRALALLGADITLIADESSLSGAVQRADAVVNLAGEPLLGGRWTRAKLVLIRESRLGLTRTIANLLKMRSRNCVLVSASAVGYYGDTGERTLTENAESGDDFLAMLCSDWESQAHKARDSRTRVVCMRIGVVLGRGGGALSKMLPPFRLGLGGPVGSGKQFVSWIHLEDLTELILTAIKDERYDGAINATGPEPVPFKALASALGRALRRPAVIPVPAFVIKALFGKSSTVLLQGQRAIPARATELGFAFRFNTIQEALNDILRGHPS